VAIECELLRGGYKHVNCPDYPFHWASSEAKKYVSVTLTVVFLSPFIQGGSDKSGILKLFLENLTAQLKIIRFYKTKKKLTDGCIENQDI
jgi:hypothetical protein